MSTENVYGRDKNNRVTINGKNRSEHLEDLLSMIEINTDYNRINQELYDKMKIIRDLGGDNDVSF